MIYCSLQYYLIPGNISMGVLERIESIIRANLSDLLDGAGDPDKVLARLVLDMEAELADAKAQMAAAIREGKRLKMFCIENQQSAEKWQKKAILGVQHGKDDLAREALLRKRTAEALVEDYRREYELHDEVIVSLKSALKALEAKIQEVKRKKTELVMRKRQMEFGRLLGRNAMADGESELERLEGKIVSLDAEVEALSEISDDELTVRLREEELEVELAKLKDKMRSENP